MKSLQHRWLGRIAGFGLTLLFSLCAAAAGFEDTMAERVRACTACHGEQGKAGPDGYYPRLAGKPADYLYNQLLNFSQGRRHYQLMSGLLGTLDAVYLREIAQHFARQAVRYPAPVPGAASADVLARGKELATRGDALKGLPACVRCHGKTLTGVLPQIPGLLGLPKDYVNAQLGGWKTGQRHAQTPDCMAQVAKRLSDADANAVAQWLSQQAPPFAYAPALNAPEGPALPVEFDCRPPAKTAVMDAKAPLNARVSAQAVRGAYLARVGNCALCHTTPGGEPYAGGKAIATPFGEVYTSNLTPDPSSGLGQWNADDFWRALHFGVSRDGRRLYPAFPYTSFTQVTREDSDALFAYLRTLTPAPRTQQDHALRWPYSTQWALRLWQALYFVPFKLQESAPVFNGTQHSEQWRRGNYLVNGLGHCAACHTPRNWLGAQASPDAGGARVAGQQAYAPSLRDPFEAGLAQWSETDIVTLLQTGAAPSGHTSGLMAEVVTHSTQHLTDADALAMAVYLKSLPQSVVQPAAVRAPSAEEMDFTRQGGRLYEKHCANCHGDQGQGREGVYPSLAASRFVTAAQTANLVRVVRQGGFTPSTMRNPRPFGMPPFQLTLNDRELASVLTYIRTSWGNRAESVSEFAVGRLQ